MPRRRSQGLHPCAVYVDRGADARNRGSVSAASCPEGRYPRARGTAYEADPALFAMLEANVATNRMADVETRHAAVWTATGSLTFRCEGSDSGMIESLPGSLAGPLKSVPSLRLRDVL